MYKINAWVKSKDGAVIRYIRSGFDFLREAMNDIDGLEDVEIIEAHIFQEA